MTVSINGKNHHFPESLSLQDLLVELKIGLTHFAIARNNEVIPRHEHPHVHIHDGDRIEIIRAVGGG